jgi:hypothetical protein
MLRSILLPSVLAFSYFTGCASQASANVSEYSVTPTLPGATINFAGSCDSTIGPPFPTPCPSAVQGLPIAFNIPQFNPLLGSLQSVQLVFKANMGGTATETNPPIIGCLPFEHCGNVGGGELSFGPVVSLSTGGSSYTLSGGDYIGCCSVGDLASDVISAPIPTAGGTATVSFPDFSSLLSDQGIFEGVPEFFPAGGPPFSSNNFIGTGPVTFNIYSVLELDSFQAEYSAVTLDPTPLELTVEYNYIPSVLPEPSLVIVTGGIFGLLVTWRMRRRRAS